MARHPASWLLWATGLVLMTAGCGGVSTSASVVAPGPVPATQARIWFYRDYEPSESLNLADINVNGAYFGSVANGSAFYRDIPPGHYRIAPVSFIEDPNEDRYVDIAPGQQLYIKIVSLRAWLQGGCRTCARDSFYAWLIPPEVAQAEIARDRAGI
jgi:Protein of unknown function (DUF2846)